MGEKTRARLYQERTVRLPLCAVASFLPLHRRITPSLKNGCGHILSITQSLTFATQGLHRIGSNMPARTAGGRESHKMATNHPLPVNEVTHWSSLTWRMYGGGL